MTQPTLFDELPNEWPHNTAAGRNMVRNGWTWEIVSSDHGSHYGRWWKVINGRTVYKFQEDAEAEYYDGPPPF